MKKWSILLCSLLLVCCYCLPIYANSATESQSTNYADYYADRGVQGTGEIVDIQVYWEENGYPDYLSYLHNSGATMASETEKILFWEIGVVDLDEQKQQEILALMAPTNIVQFYDAQYSMAERLVAYESILALEDDQIDSVTLIKNNESILVTLTGSNSQSKLNQYEQEFEREYGLDFVVSDMSNMTTDMTASDLAEFSTSNVATLLWWMVAVTLGVLLLMGMVMRRRGYQTIVGTIATPWQRKSALVKTIKQNPPIPSSAIWDNIQSKLDG